MTSTSMKVDLNLTNLLSQLKLNDIQQQQQEQQENPGLFLNNDCLLQRLHSIDNSLYNMGSSGRRLLGRSLTTDPRMTVVQPQTQLQLDTTLEDIMMEIPENIRTHRKLDRSVSEPHPSVLQARSGLQSQTSVASSSSSSSRYKTELCRPFEESGSCKYGEKCQFAHGRHELRTVARHPKYKTDLCKTYHTTGLCPYGPRCHFIHNDEERYLNVINRMLLQQQMSDSIEKAQLLQKQQAIAAALASQKALQQQQQQQGTSTRRVSTRQTSTDSTCCSEPSLSRFPFSYGTCDTLGSLSDSPSSSITDSPSPSPTSSLFSEDPVSSTSATLGAYTNPAQGVFGFNPAEIKSFQALYQQQQQQQQQQLAQMDESDSPSALSLLLAKLHLTQPQILALFEHLAQKTTSCPSPSSTTSTYCNSLPQISPRIDLTTSAASLAGDFMSRESTCYSWPYSAVEL